jgi:hypothetical protein
VFIEAGVEGRLDGGLEIVGRENDERVGAAEFEDDLLEVASGCLGDDRSRALRAGEGDPDDSRVGDGPRDLGLGGIHVGVAAWG